MTTAELIQITQIIYTKHGQKIIQSRSKPAYTYKGERIKNKQNQKPKSHKQKITNKHKEKKP